MSDHTNWEQYYSDYNRFHQSPHSSFELFTNLLHKNNSTYVLDLGCGGGRHLIPLAQDKFVVAGVDFSPAAVDLSQKWLMDKGLEGRVSIADIHEEIKYYEDDSFDAILAVDSLQYQSLQNFEDSLKQINRLLKSNGMLFLVVPSPLAKIENTDHEQLFFTKEEIYKTIQSTFVIDKYSLDESKHHVVIATEKPS